MEYSDKQIKVILDKHSLWKKTIGQEGKRAEFWDSDLSGAVLKKVNLGAASFRGTNLKKVTLQQANLSHANFSGAILVDANLHRAKINDAIFSQADLRGADFFKADLNRANLSCAILIRTRNLTIEQLFGAKSLYKSKLDPDLEAQAREKCPHLLEKPKKKQ